MKKRGYGGEDSILGVKGLISQEQDWHAYHHAKDIHFFDHYFRHLYRIFKYIDKSPLINDDRYEYAAIARAQLSEYELLMLFYNGLNVNDEGQYKFKDFIEIYSLLNNLNKGKLV